METSEKSRPVVVFAGLVLLLLLLGRMTFGVPGAEGGKGTFTEIALVIAIPFLTRWYQPVLLALFTLVDNYLNGGFLLANTLNHVVCFPLLWWGYRWADRLRGDRSLALFWIVAIAAYYFVGLIPGYFAVRLLSGDMDFWQVLTGLHALNRAVVYEYLATTFVAVFYFVMVRELRIRKAAQRDLELRNDELWRHKLLLESLYDTTQEGVLVVSPEGRMTSWNRRFLEMWRISPELMERPDNAAPIRQAIDLAEDPKLFRAQVREIISDPAGSRQDMVRLKDGRTLMRFTAPIGSEAGGFFGRVWFYRDVSDLERAQAEQALLRDKLFQSQKMEAIGQLAGGIAHDFNNSLGIVLGGADLLRMEPLSDSASGYLDMIDTAARRSVSLTRKLLSFSRQGTRNVDMIDAGAVVSDTVSLLQSSIDKGISIRIENRAERRNVMGDTGLLQNAFMNLGINASHAMPDGGSILFALENVHLETAYCEASPFKLVPGDYLAIRVQDTGCGIPPENLARIFEPFFTTKSKGSGTGLGLASVYGTVQDHDGAIVVYSELGHGTAFHIFLPLPPDPSGLEMDAPEALQEIPTGSATILLVDDEELIRKTASLLLKGLGYKVIVASDGQRAVELFRERGQEIDLVLLDMSMPVLGGRAAFEEIRRLDAEVPVVVCSGFPKDDDPQKLKALGLSVFLQKPFQRAQLAGAVAAALAEAAKT